MTNGAHLFRRLHGEEAAVAGKRDELVAGPDHLERVRGRSAERFRLLAPRLQAPLSDFYTTLERSEARHFELYLTLAHELDESKGKAESERRLKTIAEREAELATSPDEAFRFHSGAPAVVS